MLCIRAITSSEGQAGSTRPVRLDTRTGQAFSIPVALTADNHFLRTTTRRCACVAHIGHCDRIFRHNSIRDAVFSAAQSAALAPRREVPSLIPGTQSRPADIYLPCWKRGRPAALDITVISTLQQSTVRGAAENQGHALLVAEERKFASHGAACQAIGICFIPLAIESLGGMSDMTADTISSIGRLLGQRLGISPGESTRHLFQRLAISLWRGNASWIHRSPQLAPPWTVLFNLFCFVLCVCFVPCIFCVFLCISLLLFLLLLLFVFLVFFLLYFY